MYIVFGMFVHETIRIIIIYILLGTVFKIIKYHFTECCLSSIHAWHDGHGFPRICTNSINSLICSTMACDVFNQIKSV